MDSKDKRTGWLRNLEVGSQVFIYNYGSQHLDVITGITPTGRISVGSNKYNEHGFEIGSRHGWRLAPCTEEGLNQYLKKQSTDTLKFRINEVMEMRHHIKWEEKDLIDVWNILRKYTKKENDREG